MDSVAQAVAAVARGSAYPFAIGADGGWAWNMPSQPSEAQLQSAVEQCVRATIATQGLLVNERRVRPSELLFDRETPSAAVDAALFSTGTLAQRDVAVDDLRVVLAEGLPWAEVQSVDHDDDPATGEIVVSVTFSPLADIRRTPRTANVVLSRAQPG